jgi:hypothetical protein
MHAANAKALASAGLRVSGGRLVDDQWCLDRKRRLRIELPAELEGPGSLVVVAEPGTARDNGGWSIVVDGDKQPLRAPSVGRRERDTLGPFARTKPPRKMEIRGSKRRTESASCPYGAVAAIRWLGADRPSLADATATALTLAPPDDLGHTVEAARWVSARAVSRYRPGTKPKPELHALSLVLRPRKALRFTPIFAPNTGRDRAVDLVVTLTGTALAPDARIILNLNEREVARIDPPEDSNRSWQSAVIRTPLKASTASLELKLVGDDDPEHYARVRDVAIFGIAAEVTSQFAP